MKISHQWQIRIQKKIMLSLGIEKGDYLEVAIHDNQIVLKLRKLIDPSQGWYWTKEWQKMESQADEVGRYQENSEGVEPGQSEIDV